MRVKKRVKRGVKKGIKRVKSAPPEAYLAGAGALVGGAAVVLLATHQERPRATHTHRSANPPPRSGPTEVPGARRLSSGRTGVPRFRRAGRRRQ